MSISPLFRWPNSVCHFNETILSERGIRPKTLLDYASKIRAIRRKLPDKPLTDISTKEVAAMLNTYVAEGKAASAKLIR
ncbi:integrase, partial [Shigella flexneri]|nr:integrase [Shigella flexneri]